MDVTWEEVILRRNKVSGPTDVFTEMKGNEMQDMLARRKEMLPPAESVWMAEQGYLGAHFDHFMNFFEGVRNGTPAKEDAVFGLRAAAPALACNNSYFEERIMKWDPEEMRIG